MEGGKPFLHRTLKPLFIPSIPYPFPATESPSAELAHSLRCWSPERSSVWLPPSLYFPICFWEEKECSLLFLLRHFNGLVRDDGGSHILEFAPEPHLHCSATPFRSCMGPPGSWRAIPVTTLCLGSCSTRMVQVPRCSLSQSGRASSGCLSSPFLGGSEFYLLCSC